LAAYLVFYRRLPGERLLFRLPAQVGVVLAAAYLVSHLRDSTWHGVLEAVAWAILIVQVACGPKPIRWLESPGLRYLGNISYGIYMVHTSIIALTLTALGSGAAGSRARWPG